MRGHLPAAGRSVGILQGAITLFQPSFDLVIATKVVRENDDLLQGTIGVVIVCGNGIETQCTLEFTNGFFVVHSVPSHAVP